MEKRRKNMKKNKTLKKLLCVLLAALMISIIAMPAFAKSDAPVARLSVVSYVKNIVSHGHSWLYIENISKKTLTVGVYELKPGEAVSVGTFKYSRKEGKGIYYNVELYCNEHYGANGRYSLTTEITESQLASVSKKINNYGSKWTPVKNCAYFVANVWNGISSIRLISGSTPFCLKTSIRLHGGKRNIAMQGITADKVFKQKGSSLVQVRSSALSSGL